MIKKQVQNAVHVYTVHNTIDSFFIKDVCTLPKTGTFCLFKLCVPESELLSLLVIGSVLRYLCSFDEFVSPLQRATRNCIQTYFQKFNKNLFNYPIKNGFYTIVSFVRRFCFWIFLNFVFFYKKLRKTLFKLTLKSLIQNDRELFVAFILTESSQLLFCWSAV
jgi:hypothetical protein